MVAGVVDKPHPLVQLLAPAVSRHCVTMPVLAPTAAAATHRQAPTAKTPGKVAGAVLTRAVESVHRAALHRTAARVVAVAVRPAVILAVRVVLAPSVVQVAVVLTIRLWARLVQLPAAVVVAPKQLTAALVALVKSA